ncbi:hypothetical protein V8E36_005877 [Tilletia maclaganii]
MLFFCGTTILYEHHLIADRHPFDATSGFFSWVARITRRGGRADAYTPLPVVANDDDEKRD